MGGRKRGLAWEPGRWDVKKKRRLKGRGWSSLPSSPERATSEPPTPADETTPTAQRHQATSTSDSVEGQEGTREGKGDSSASLSGGSSDASPTEETPAAQAPSASSTPPTPRDPRIVKRHKELERVELRVKQEYDWTPDNHINLEETTSALRGFGGLVTKQGFKINPLPGFCSAEADGAEYLAKLEAVLAHGVKRILIDVVNPNHMGQVIIHNPNLHTQYLATKWTKFANFSFDNLMGKFVEAKNSEDINGGTGIRLEDTEFHFIQLDHQKFGGVKPHQQFKKRLEGDQMKFAAGKRSILEPLGAHQKKRLPAKFADLCMIMSVVLGKDRVDRPGLDSQEYSNYHKSGKNKFGADVEALIASSGLSPEGPHSLEDLRQVQATLGDEYQISCFCPLARFHNGDRPFKTFGPGEGKAINLWLMMEPPRGEEEDQADASFGTTGHCMLITNVVGLQAKPAPSSRHFKYCSFCQTSYSGDYHRCSAAKCQLCQRIGCKGREKKERRGLWQYRLECGEGCSRVFFGPACLAHHREAEGSVCGNTRRCHFCRKEFPKGKEKSHKLVCGRIAPCFVCKKKNEPFDHVCFMQKPAPQKRGRSQRWYGDIESRVAEDGTHHPNLLILKNPLNSDTLVFFGEDCIQQFLALTSEKDNPFKDSYVIFHNMGGYDGHFILQQMVKENLAAENLILKGHTILSFDLPSREITFRDSLRFIPNTPLSAFPAMFGLASTKGTFPHTLNKPQELEKPFFEKGGVFFPPQSYFEPEKMSTSARATFEKWWTTEKARYDSDPELRYVVKEELHKYCLLDVDILMEGFEQFLADAKAKHPAVNPLHSMTSPSYCNFVYRDEDMPANSIALLPPQGFKPAAKTFSDSELAWVAWQRAKRRLTVLHTNRNYRSIFIAGYSVDGYGKDSQGNAYVFEFDGCYFHGCHCNGIPNTAKQESKRLHTLHKHQILRHVGASDNSPYGNFRLVTIKECQFKRQQECDPEMKVFVKRYIESIRQVPCLSLEESFFGGRTTPIMHKCDAGDGQTIGYADFTSLYPAVNACNRQGEEYPIGYPSVLIGCEVQDRFGPDIKRALLEQRLFGVVHCEVYPPRQLRHPVVPVRLNDKLLFPLCFSCASEESQTTCHHSDEQRKLTVHLPTPEIRKALEMGYRLGRVFEAWHFAERSSSLLRGYITKHYMEKEYASGFPTACLTDKDKQDHTSACSKALFDTPADVTKFAKNSGKRTLHKGMLNNFWGFFGKRDDHVKDEMISTKHELLGIMNDSTRDIVSFNMVGDLAFVGTRVKDPPPGANTSRLIASFTTSLARLRLYEVLQQFSENIIYMDTDSVFFFKSAKGPGPQTPGSLGELKDEIAAAYPNHPGAYIRSFTSTGPKSYAYEVCDSAGNLIDTQIRLKGITAAGQSRLSHSHIRQLTDKQLSNIKVQQTQFCKNLHQQRVSTKESAKTLRFISTKRRFIETSTRLDTLPYGYVDRVD